MQLQIQNFGHLKKNRLLSLKVLLLVIECLFFSQTEHYLAWLQLHEQIENICVIGNIQKRALKIFGMAQNYFRQFNSRIKTKKNWQEWSCELP